jgi:hypothetical protein
MILISLGQYFSRSLDERVGGKVCGRRRDVAMGEDEDEAFGIVHGLAF